MYLSKKIPKALIQVRSRLDEVASRSSHQSVDGVKVAVAFCLCRNYAHAGDIVSHLPCDEDKSAES